jgi:hypothetical protein
MLKNLSDIPVTLSVTCEQPLQDKVILRMSDTMNTSENNGRMEEKYQISCKNNKSVSWNTDKQIRKVLLHGRW